jgi:7-carboxy-7-deazaguanine synthase
MVTVIAQTPIRLRITEIFHSLQGETSTVGIPTVFVRLTGCPLRCQYCDTAYAFHGGEMIELPAILDRVASFGAQYVTVTGGEPLAQPACLPLLERLCDAGYVTSLETSGALDVSHVDSRVVRVVDLKTPGSRESERNRWENIPLLTKRDQVKFVICDVNDYAWSRDKTFEYDLPNRVGEVLFSPSHTELPAAQLAEWILRDRLPVRMQIQLHKVLWGNEPGR